MELPLQALRRPNGMYCWLYIVTLLFFVWDPSCGPTFFEDLTHVQFCVFLNFSWALLSDFQSKKELWRVLMPHSIKTNGGDKLSTKEQPVNS